MQAVISGQLGRAVVVNGDRLRLLDLADNEGPREFSSVNLNYLLQGATDLLSVEADTEEKIFGLLDDEWKKDKALLLFLILIDSSEHGENRFEAAEALSELIENDGALSFIFYRLSSTPLPQIASIDEAIKFSDDFAAVKSLIEAIQELQPSIETCREAWNGLDSSLFKDLQERDLFEQRATDIGLFYKFSAAIAANDAQAFTTAQFDAHTDKVLSDLWGNRDIIKQWSSQLVPGSTKILHEESIAGFLADEHDSYAGDEAAVYARQEPAHEAFRKVTTQIDEIKTLIRKLDIDKAQKFINQLISYQISHGDQNYAAKSLCNIASYAVDTYQYSLALECMKKAVEVAPEDGWSWGQLGDVYLHLAEFDQAREAFEKASVWQEEHFGANGLARILRYRGHSVAALEAAISVEQRFSSHEGVWNTLILIGDLYREQGEYDRAQEIFLNAVGRFPEEADPRCHLGDTLMEIGEFGKAFTVYQDATKFCAPSVDAYVGVGKVHQERGEFETALDLYNAAKKKFPLEPLPCMRRAEVLSYLKKFDDAMDEYAWLRDEFPYDFAGFKGRAELLREQGKYGFAEEQFDAAISRFPKEPILYARRAYLFKQARRLTDALQSFSQTCQQFPTNTYARLGQADLFKELGKYDEALELYRDISKTVNTSVVESSVAAINLAKGDYASVLANEPSSPPRNKTEWVSLHIYGMALLKAGQTTESISLFETALGNVPFASQKPYFSNALALAYLRKQDYETAAKLADRQGDAITQVITLHTAAATNDVARAEFALNSLQNDCPENIVSLRDELAAQFKLIEGTPYRDADWIFDQECNVLALNATFQAAA